MTKSWRIIFFVLLALVLSGVFAGQARAWVCSDKGAPWNKDKYLDPNGNKGLTLSPLFACMDLSKATSYVWNGTKWYRDYTVPSGTETQCGGADTTNRCARVPDCAQIGGTCYDTDTDTIPAGWTKTVQLRCGGDTNNKCYFPPVSATPPSEPPPEEVPTVDVPVEPTIPKASTTPSSTPTQISMSLSNCCRQIVPVLPDEYDANGRPIGAGDYQLNHFVQLGINIYNCIVCIVGSLMLLMIVIGGFFMLISAGDKGKVKTGQDYIKGAVIGGIIVFASFLIVNFFVKTLGAGFINSNKVQINAGVAPKPTKPATP